MGENCYQRVGCQLCIDKHEHKFYLDPKQSQRDITSVREQIEQKITHLKKYTESHIHNLKLEEYKKIVEQNFHDELLFLQNKV